MSTFHLDFETLDNWPLQTAKWKILKNLMKDQKLTQFIIPRINFINILHASILYESQNISAKCALKC